MCMRHTRSYRPATCYTFCHETYCILRWHLSVFRSPGVWLFVLYPFNSLAGNVQVNGACVVCALAMLWRGGKCAVAAAAAVDIRRPDIPQPFGGRMLLGKVFSVGDRHLRRCLTGETRRYKHRQCTRSTECVHIVLVVFVIRTHNFHIRKKCDACEPKCVNPNAGWCCVCVCSCLHTPAKWQLILWFSVRASVGDRKTRRRRWRRSFAVDGDDDDSVEFVELCVWHFNAIRFAAHKWHTQYYIRTTNRVAQRTIMNNYSIRIHTCHTSAQIQ